jgi:acyl dehydratase
MTGRFTKPVMPGYALHVQIWRDGKHARFRTLGTDGSVVIDRGTATFGDAF